MLNPRPARRTQNNNRNATAGQILLIAQIHIGRNKHIEPNGLSGIKQFAIFQCRPVLFESGRHFMLRQRKAERNWRTLIKQNTHLSGDGERASRRMFKHRSRLIQRDPGEPFDELRNLRTVLEILEHRGDRYTRVPEHPSTADAVWVLLNGRTGRPINHGNNRTTTTRVRPTSRSTPKCSRAEKRSALRRMSVSENAIHFVFYPTIVVATAS